MSNVAPAEGAPPPTNVSAPRPRGLKALALRLWHAWATRSLAVGGVATVMDVSVLLVLVKLFDWPAPFAAMAGVTVGSTVTFFANRHFAFRDHNPELAPQALRFMVFTGVGMVFHASIVYLFTDRLGVPVVLAKLGADVCVFTFAQLLVLRFIVFPKRKEAPQRPQEAQPPNARTPPQAPVPSRQSERHPAPG
jgi:putative flippase GtrA